LCIQAAAAKSLDTTEHCKSVVLADAKPEMLFHLAWQHCIQAARPRLERSMCKQKSLQKSLQQIDIQH